MSDLVACSGALCWASSKASLRSHRLEKEPPNSLGTTECVPMPMPCVPPSGVAVSAPAWKRGSGYRDVAILTSSSVPVRNSEVT